MRGRHGVILYLVMLILLVLLILVGAFSQATRHGRTVAFRFEQNEIARQIAESAMSEAHAAVCRDARSFNSPTGQWFVERRSVPLPIDTPVSRREAANLIRRDFELDLTASARLIDFRGNDSRGRPYLPKEGVGTLEIAIESRIMPTFGSPAERQRPTASCRLVRHHDYKVVSLVSPRDNAQQRTAHAQNAILDYTFFVRFGLNAFRESLAQTLDPAGVRVALEQDELPVAQRGKVFIGGTADPGKPGDAVWLNIDERFAGVLPNFLPQEIKSVPYGVLRQLIPKLADVEAQVALIPGAMAQLQQIRGQFSGRVEPLVKREITGPLADCEKLTRRYLDSLARGVETNLNAGLELLSRNPVFAAVPGNADAVFEGAIRQRFLWFVSFRFDFSALPATLRQRLTTIEKDYPCTPTPNPPPENEYLRQFTQNLPGYAAAQPAADPPLVSKYDSDFLYRGGAPLTARLNPDSFPRPRFFNVANQQVVESAIGEAGFQAFGHINLWARRVLQVAELERLGIIDRVNNRLNLRGIVWVEEPVELGRGGVPMTIVGQGVLIAGGFRISGALTKRGPGDLAVLCTRVGNIEVDTEAPVEAALVAIGQGPGRTGRVTPLRRLQLHGALACETLDTGRWPKGVDHTVRYDPVFKNGEIWAINISPSGSYERLTEVD